MELDRNEMKNYTVTYRNEISVNVEAKNEDEAAYKASISRNWSFIREGHKDSFEIEKEDE